MLQHNTAALSSIELISVDITVQSEAQGVLLGCKTMGSECRYVQIIDCSWLMTAACSTLLGLDSKHYNAAVRFCSTKTGS